MDFAKLYDGKTPITGRGGNIRGATLGACIQTDKRLSQCHE